MDWSRWPGARASGRPDASTDRGAREPRRARRASDTWCESSSNTRLHRATSHKQRLENDPGNVLRVDEPEPHPVPPGGVRVPAKASTRSPPEKKSYGHPGSKMREAYTELGKQRWSRRRSLARRQQPSGFLLRVLLRNRMTQQRSHFFLDVDDDVRLTQIFGETCVLSLQLQVFFFQRISIGLRPTFLWGQSLEDSLGPLSPPVGQQRRVQTFAAEKGAQATTRRRSNFGFF